MGNELYHYGVPGMRWGIRKIRKVATSNKPRNEKEVEKYKQAKKIYSKTQNMAKNLKSTTNWTKRQKERIAFNMLKGDSQKRAEGKENAPGWSLEALEYIYKVRNAAANGHETLDTDSSAVLICRFPISRKVYRE